VALASTPTAPRPMLCPPWRIGTSPSMAPVGEGGGEGAARGEVDGHGCTNAGAAMDG
jgi:hypothetical protein